jgi:hypothetical protein
VLRGHNTLIPMLAYQPVVRIDLPIQFQFEVEKRSITSGEVLDVGTVQGGTASTSSALVGLRSTTACDLCVFQRSVLAA